MRPATKDPIIRFLRDRRGHSVAYAEHGNGPLVICPGWWVSNVEKDWAHSEFRLFFERLGQGLRIVRYDRPGVGLSDRDVRGRTLKDEVELLSDIADVLGEPRYALFAISCGGPIAIHHAAHCPDKVMRICFYGSFLDGREICSLEVQEAVRSLVRAHWGMGSRALADIFFPDATRETIEAFSRQSRSAASADVAEELLKLTYTMDARDAARDLKADCLVIHRSGDRAIPFEAGRTLAAKLPSARLVTLKGRAHPPWMDGDDIADTSHAFFSDTTKEIPAVERSAATPTTSLFDEKNRCLTIDGRNIPLTPLEFGVLRHLVAKQGQVVSRDELLQEVWNQAFEGSNKIDAVISSLRKKLLMWSASIQTVTGHGYRFTSWTKKS